MQIYGQFRIILLKKISKLGEYTDRWLSENTKTIHEQNENFNKKNRNHWKKLNRKPTTKNAMTD